MIITSKGGTRMALIIDTKEYLNTVCTLLTEGKTDVPVPVTGNSMCPFLHPGDIVYLNLPGTPKRGDIVLFTRPDGSFVLHRIYRVCRDGSFLLLGDNQLIPEPVPAAQIQAKVTGARRKDKPLKVTSFRWWCYTHLWTRPVRRIAGKLR